MLGVIGDRLCLERRPEAGRDERVDGHVALAGSMAAEWLGHASVVDVEAVAYSGATELGRLREVGRSAGIAGTRRGIRPSRPGHAGRGAADLVAARP